MVDVDLHSPRIVPGAMQTHCLVSEVLMLQLREQIRITSYGNLIYNCPGWGGPLSIHSIKAVPASVEILQSCLTTWIPSVRLRRSKWLRHLRMHYTELNVSKYF